MDIDFNVHLEPGEIQKVAELSTTVGESQTPGDDEFRVGIVDWLASCAGVKAAWRRKEDADSKASD